MAADSIFIDTNVLVFASVATSPMHASALAALHAVHQSGAAAWISRQVIRELLVHLTHPRTLPAAFAPAVAANQAAALLSLYRVADETSQVTGALLNLLRSIGANARQVHDANIVATMQTYGIPRLLTHNVADFQRYSSLITVVPLAS